MAEMRVDAGAASVKLFGLGNANVERIDANVGVGRLELDFGGAWQGDVDLSVTSALGSVELSVPESVAIRVERTSFLHSFSAQGLTKQNGYWVSANWETAQRKLHVRSTGTLGSLEIRRIAR
jgi:predicted membrane protein